MLEAPVDANELRCLDLGEVARRRSAEAAPPSRRGRRERAWATTPAASGAPSGDLRGDQAVERGRPPDAGRAKGRATTGRASAPGRAGRTSVRSASSTGLAGCFSQWTRSSETARPIRWTKPPSLPVDPGVEHVPAAVVLDRAAGPGGEVVPAARRARDAARREALARWRRSRETAWPIEAWWWRSAGRLERPRAPGGRRCGARRRRGRARSPRPTCRAGAASRRSHPLSDPCSSAATKCRWKTKKTMIIGVRISSDPAESSGMLVPHWPWKAPSAPAIVRFDRVVDEHDREQELVPRPDRRAGSRATRSQAGRAARGRARRAARCVAPSTRAASESSLRHVHEVRAHPEDPERHEQADQRQDDRPAGVQQAHAADLVVDRDDHALERQRETEQEQRRRRAGRRGSRR